MRSLLRQILLFFIVLSLLAAVLIHPLLMWLGKDIYVNNVEILYILLVAVSLNAFSMVPHYGLYAISNDRQIVFSHVLTFLVFIGFAALLTQWSSIYGVPLALCGAFGGMLVHKTLAYRLDKARHIWIKLGNSLSVEQSTR